MQRQKLNWTLILLLLSILILGLTACGGQSESEAPAATTAEEKAAEGAEAEAPAPTEETTAAEEPEAEAPAPTEETTTVEEPEETVEVGETSQMADSAPDALATNIPIPILAEAQDVAYDTDRGEVTYTTLSDAETVTDFYRQSLSAEGWQADEDSVMANDVFVNITFERGEESIDINSIDVSVPTRVTVNIRYAPSLVGTTGSEASMGEETTMGNIPTFLTPADAQDVAYDADIEQITYAIPSDVATVVEFYRQSLPAEGWQEKENFGMVKENIASLIFEWGDESLHLSMIVMSGQTDVTVLVNSAPSLMEIIEGGPSTGEDRAATGSQANVGDTIEMGDLSFAVTEVTSPAEINYSQPFEGNKFIALVFTIENRHASDTLEANYLSLGDLVINDYDGNSYEAYSLALREVDDPDAFHNGQIAPGDQVRGEVEFQVPVEAEELVFVIDMARLGSGKVFVALPETEAPPMAGSAGGEIPAFLTPADAQDVVYDADFRDIAYTTPSDVETVVEFYRQSLPVEGWQENEVSSAVDENFAFVQFDQGEDTLYIDITLIDTGITEVTMDMSFALPLVETIEGKTSTGTETTPSDSGPLSLVEEEGFLVPSDYVYLSTMETPFALMVTFGSPSKVDTLVELYETEMPGQGWEFIEHGLGGDVARLYFGSGDQKLSIDLRVNDGEISPDLAGQTSVEMNIKDPVAAAEAEILPPPGQSRILLMNGAEVELTATINQQELKLTPIPMSTEFPKDPPSIDLPPGQYTLTISAPDGSVINEDFEIGLDQEIAPDEVWAFILDVGMSPMQWPVY